MIFFDFIMWELISSILGRLSPPNTAWNNIAARKYNNFCPKYQQYRDFT